MSKDNQKHDSESVDVNDSTDQRQDQSELEIVKEELQNEKSRRLQVMADFENFRRRMEEERSTFGALANLGIIRDLIEINDDIRMALADSDLDLESSKKAMENVQSKLLSTASQAGIEPLKVEKGSQFDSNSMEAITAVEVEGMSGKVIDVVSSGYKYTGKDGIISPSKVVVGK